METLSEYDYILQHVPGHLNTMADLLSQHPDLKEGVKTVNDDITVLPDHLFINKITLPNDIIKRRKAVYELYDTPIAGHPGMANTWALVNQRYKGHKIWEFVKQYIKGCPICQMNKSQHKAQAPVQHLDVPTKEGPFQYISMDLITNLPQSRKYNAILTIVDQGCSKVHQQEHSLLPDFLLVPSRKVVQVAQVHKLNIGLLFNTNFNNINLFN